MGRSVGIGSTIDTALLALHGEVGLAAVGTAALAGERSTVSTLDLLGFLDVALLELPNLLTRCFLCSKIVVSNCIVSSRAINLSLGGVTNLVLSGLLFSELTASLCEVIDVVVVIGDNLRATAQAEALVN